MDIFLGLFILTLGFGVYLYFKLNSYDGTIYLSEDEDGQKTYFLDLKYDPHDLNNKKRIIFKVIGEEDQSI